MTDLQATIDAAWDTADFYLVFEREFSAIRGVSIDYAVMEHAKSVVVIEAVSPPCSACAPAQDHRVAPGGV